MVSPAERAVVDQAWDDAVTSNPALFDGPVVVCLDLHRRGSDELVLVWTRSTYRSFALRRVPGARAPLPGLFVGVLQPTEDGRVLVGRSSSSTAVPGRWQLPGGSVEPPGQGGRLDAVALAGNAARELAEETGVVADVADLRLRCVTRSSNGNLGFHYLAPPRPEAHLRERFEAQAAAEVARGLVPELEQILLVRAADIERLAGPYSEPLLPVATDYLTGADGQLEVVLGEQP
ncbi:NUDIX domain-containing protein [Frankia sp. EI5c]|uniref:NUDIX domain-containing protein n=1 Tax=Frankia sp. EI5c TaxID=683316 RepID=UPI001A7EE8F6|nr:NUDIX domain-containing protein [Frankia sp. EI5c]